MNATKPFNTVISMCRRTIAQRPEVSSTDLYERALKLDPRIKRMTVRQFHARFPLQIKKQRALAEAPKRRAARTRR